MDQQTLRKVQLLQLEMAKEIRRVCLENGIRYTLYRGTFLGAVRHKGFIPWDDDIDFAMLREDYEKFRRIAPEKLNQKYCFQDWNTEKNYALPFGKVRMRNTVFVEAKSAALEECGVYVDIYPLDFAPASQEEKKVLAGKLLHLFRLKLMKCGYTPWMEENRVLWKKRVGYLAYQFVALFFSHEKLIKRYNDLVMAVPAGETVYEQSALPKAYYYPRAWYEAVEEYPFEDAAFAGPKAYDEVLSCLYGNYMELPPADKRENRHQILKLDLGDE